MIIGLLHVAFGVFFHKSEYIKLMVVVLITISAIDPIPMYMSLMSRITGILIADRCDDCAILPFVAAIFVNDQRVSIVATIIFATWVARVVVSRGM